MALKPIPEKEVLISVPVRFLITRQKVEESLMPRLVRRDPDMTTHHLIAVFLLEELSKGSNSFWYPYLKTLPESYTVPFFCGSIHSVLLPKYVLDKCLKQQDIVKSAYDKVRAVFNLEIDFGRFAWAWFTVNTRAVYFNNGDGDRSSDNNLALAPFLDMFNHSGDVTVNVGVASALNFSEGLYQIVSTNKRYKKFDQVFINYGPHDNLKLCLEYGFVLDSNPNDLVPISLDELAGAIPTNHIMDKRINKAFEFIQAQGLDKNLGFTPGSEVFTWNSLSCLFVLSNFSYPEKWSRIYSMDSECLLSDREIRSGLRVILDSKLVEAETFLAASVEATTTPSLSVVRQLVEIHRKILLGALTSLKRHLKA